MITESIFDIFFNFSITIIGLLPTFDFIPTLSFPTFFLDFLKTGLYFTGTTGWVVAIGTFVATYTVAFGWSLIEWAYKKVPGVD